MLLCSLMRNGSRTHCEKSFYFASWGWSSSFAAATAAAAASCAISSELRRRRRLAVRKWRRAATKDPNDPRRLGSVFRSCLGISFSSFTTSSSVNFVSLLSFVGRRNDDDRRWCRRAAIDDPNELRRRGGASFSVSTCCVLSSSSGITFCLLEICDNSKMTYTER